MRDANDISSMAAKKKLIDEIRESLIKKKIEGNDSEEIEFLLKRFQKNKSNN
jgi:hypothetical protein